MKISYRILLINFTIIAIILGSSAIAFYTIMYKVLTSQQTQYLLNSASDFNYAYGEMSQNADDNFLYLLNNEQNGLFSKLDYNKNIDFILTAGEKNSKLIKQSVSKKTVFIPSGSFTISEFFKNNPYAVINFYHKPGEDYYYYGKIITKDFLNDLSKKINANIALIWNNSPSEVSNENNTLKYSYILNEAYDKLASKNNYDIYSNSYESNDVLATIIKPSNTSFEKKHQLKFLIFTTLNEAADLRSSLKYILIIIGSAGIILSLILTFVFTDKIRKRLTRLSKAAEITKSGNFNNRIEVQSKDEIGSLATAFNDMLGELEKNEKSKKEYSEFITLINQNPTLQEISDSALRKIIKTCGFAVGALYSVDNNKISLTSSYGLKKEYAAKEKSDFFEAVIKRHETIEFSSNHNLPVVTTGVFRIQIKHILIIPIVYNNKVIAILELGSINKPTAEAKDYLAKIQEQLAIGLTNASAVVQLENFVTKLKKLNADYQKQNLQIRKQNETLVDLHKKLKDKAHELEVQKEKAEEATKLKSHFLASMSHELRTPMNSILGLTELILEDTTVVGKNRERIQVVLKSGKRLMNLINDILDLSKIEAGKMEIHSEDVMLDEVIKDVEGSIAPLAVQKNIKFKVNRKTNTGIIINTDKGKITQVLINLLGNAVKFTENGYVELTISSKNNKILTFDVTDSGIGISEEDQKIIFEEFRQIDGTTTRKYSGTGLGLAICKKIADLMDGDISLQSEYGKGSTFTFSIPLRFIKVKEEDKRAKLNIDTLIRNRKNPILVIDDDPEIRYTIGQYLTSKGYEVAYAPDGEKGIEEAIKIQPFAITLDVMMPKKDGWTILKELKENEHTKDIPVILISIIADKNIGYGLGAFEYFVKPITSEKLLSAFNKLENMVNKDIEKIVIVDDDELEFERFKREFKDDKVRIEYIKDSELAFSKILEVQPDLIILDLIMPKIDGVSLSYKLKANKDTKHIPIIISTAKDLTEEERKSLNNTVEDVTVKSKGHPLDVLKVVRDRIKMHEDYSAKNDIQIEDAKVEIVEIKSTKSENPEIIDKESDNINYRGEVLIVDDDADTLFTVSEIVQSCNCKTILAKSGKECLQILEKKTPDLILLDIMMPEMDGFQTLNKIKGQSRWSEIPIYAVTAKAMLEDKEVILRHGFNDYIAKPVNSSIMAFKIEKVFAKRKNKLA